VVQMKGNVQTYILHQVLSPSKCNQRCSGRSKIVPCDRRELEEIFALVLLEKNAGVELKSIAKESLRAGLPIPV
jgi:hypothetical protein